MNSTKSNIFQFKQFAVDQTGCGMKINTDGVLLGALAKSENPFTVLDIGTGTGVIALMLSQRFSKAKIEAIEIDKQAADTAFRNFSTSQYSDRLTLYHQSFQSFSQERFEKRYDLIVSNPPFFTNSLKNHDSQKQLARHTNNLLFRELVAFLSKHLNATGSAYFILPLDATEKVVEEGLKQNLKPLHIINIKSADSKLPHRRIIRLGFSEEYLEESFIIYQSEKVYSAQYQNALKDFFTIF